MKKKPAKKIANSKMTPEMLRDAFLTAVDRQEKLGERGAKDENRESSSRLEK